RCTAEELDRRNRATAELAADQLAVRALAVRRLELRRRGSSDLAWVQADVARGLEVDLALGHQTGEVHLQRLHAFALVGGDDVAQLRRLALADEVADGVVADHDLERRNQATAVARQEPLVDD